MVENHERHESSSSASGSSRSPDEDADSFNRRKILSGILAGSATLLGPSRTVAATNPSEDRLGERRRSVIEPYDDIDTLRQAVIENVAPVLDDLHEEGFLATTNPNQLGIESLKRKHDPGKDGLNVDAVRKTDEEEYSTLLKARIRRGKHTIHFSINPDIGTTIARVLNSEDSVVYETSNVEEVLSPDETTESGDEVSSLDSNCSWGCSTTEGGTWIGKCEWNCKTQ